MTIHQHVADARGRFRDAGLSTRGAELDARLLAQFVLGWTAERFIIVRKRARAARFREQVRSARREADRPRAARLHRRTAGILGPVVRGVAGGADPPPRNGADRRSGARTVSRDGSPPESGRRVYRKRMRRRGACERASRGTDHRHRHFGCRAGGGTAERRTPRRRRSHCIPLRGSARRHRGSVRSDRRAIRPMSPSATGAGCSPRCATTNRTSPCSAAATDSISSSGWCRSAVHYLRPGGYLLCEFGLGQDERVESLVADTSNLRLIELRRDLQGIAAHAPSYERRREVLASSVVEIVR